MWDYTDKVMDHFLNPRNVGEIENADAVGVVGNLSCGDALKLFLKLDDEKKKIIDVKFQTFGCASAIASSSALTEMVQGMSLEDANNVTNNDIADFLGELPKEKMHCSVMGMEALQAALAELRGETYVTHDDHIEHIEHMEKQDDYDPEGLDHIVCICFGVTERTIREVVVDNKLTDLQDVTNYCKAGGACGGCLDEIQEIMDKVHGEIKNKEQQSEDSNKPKKMTNIQRMKLIQKTLDETIAPALQKDGGNIELIDIDGKTVIVQLTGACACCPSSQQTLKNWVEAQLKELVDPEIIVERGQ